MTAIVFKRTAGPTVAELIGDMRNIVCRAERRARVESVRAAVAIAQRTGSHTVIAPLAGVLVLLDAATERK